MNDLSNFLKDYSEIIQIADWIQPIVSLPHVRPIVTQLTADREKNMNCANKQSTGRRHWFFSIVLSSKTMHRYINKVQWGILGRNWILK